MNITFTICNDYKKKIHWNNFRIRESERVRGGKKMTIEIEC